ncbi:MAG: HEPN domain-containing protein [Eubacteriales bacterium]|nr:HEPN domain-containing protein [Eubacteriales bacterium]
METLETYKDFADNSYQYFMFAYNNNQLFNEMGAMAQNICERYLKHIISEFAEPETDKEAMEKERALRTHNLRSLIHYLCKTMGLSMPRSLIQALHSVNGFYFSTRYPGEDSITLDSEDMDDCADALKQCKAYVEELIEEL